MANPNYYLPINYPQQYQAYQPMPQQNVPQQPMVQQPTQIPQQPTQGNNGIIWVLGESAARSYPVAPNTSVLLMDSEESVFYIKATDISGVPQPLRIFDYKERTQQTSHNNAVTNVPAEQAVTREEFDKLKEDVTRLSKGIRKPNINRDNKEE